MIIKIYRILLLLQIFGTTAVGFFTFNVMGTIVGFIVGVLVAGHFLTTLDTRDLNVQNTKLLKSILEELKKKPLSAEKQLIESKTKEDAP